MGPAGGRAPHRRATDGRWRRWCATCATAYAARVRRHGARDGRSCRYSTPTTRCGSAICSDRRDDPDSLTSRQLAYWRETLRGAAGRTHHADDRPRPAVASLPRRSGGRRRDRAGLTGGWWAGPRESRASVFMVLQAAFAMLLSRLGAGPTSRSARRSPDGPTKHSTIWSASSSTPWSCARTCRAIRRSGELLGRVRETDLAAYAHQDVPFEQLVDVLNPTRSLARTPCSRSCWSCRTPSRPPGRLAGPARTDRGGRAGRGGAAKFDLTLTLAELRDAEGTAAGVHGVLEYSLDLFDQAAARAHR